MAGNEPPVANGLGDVKHCPHPKIEMDTHTPSWGLLSMRGGNGRVTGAVPMPNAGAPQGQGRWQNYGAGYLQPDRRGSGGSDGNTVPAHRREVSPILPNVTSAEQPPEHRP